MPHQEQPEFDDGQFYEDIDQWNCFQCHKPISSTRPPIYNSDNCSCAEVGNRSTAEYSSHPMIREQPVYHYDKVTQYHTQRAQSYASSSVSGRGPEGPEREDPNAKHLTHGYLPLVAPEGLNEMMVQRAASFYSDLSYPMQKFLGEEEHYGTEHQPAENGFLDQHPPIQSSKKVQGRKLSNNSYMSMQSSSPDASFYSYGLDPVTAAGTWVEAEHLRVGNGYAMTLTGLTELQRNDDENMK